MNLIIFKILVSIVIVLSLAFLAERVNPKWSGILLGFPLAAALSTFFYGLEQGVLFVQQGIPYSIVGLLSSCSFCVGFYGAGKSLKINNHILHALTSSFGGIVIFFLMSSLFLQFKINLLESVILFLLGSIPLILFFQHVPKSNKIKAKRMNLARMLFRCFLVVTMVVVITGIAKRIGPFWAGMMASFPVNTFSLVFILALEYKDKLYPEVLKHGVYSISTIVVFYLLAYFLFPMLGIYLAMGIMYVVCVGYLYALTKMIERFKN